MTGLFRGGQKPVQAGEGPGFADRMPRMAKSELRSPGLSYLWNGVLRRSSTHFLSIVIPY